MQTLFHDSPEEVGRSGKRYTRAELLTLSSTTPFTTRLPLPHYTLTLLAPTIAMATYISDVTYGATREISERMSLWAYTDARWMLRYHQGTPRDML